MATEHDGPSGEDKPDAETRSGSALRTASDGYQIASEESARASDEPVGSGGYQIGSDQPALSEEGPEPTPNHGDEDGFMDPYEAYAEVAARVAAEEKRAKERQNPAIWLPGSDDLDQGADRQPDQETGFSRDRWRRGNPQVSVRLRPLDFEGLRRAAELYGVRPTTLARMMVIRGVRAILDAELRKSGDELRGGRY